MTTDHILRGTTRDPGFPRMSTRGSL